jgi:hypothetical protein
MHGHQESEIHFFFQHSFAQIAVAAVSGGLRQWECSLRGFRLIVALKSAYKKNTLISRASQIAVMPSTLLSVICKVLFVRRVTKSPFFHSFMREPKSPVAGKLLALPRGVLPPAGGNPKGRAS